MTDGTKESRKDLPRLRLRIHDAEDVVPRVFRVERGPVTLGRGDYHSVVLSDPRVSMDHAQIVERDGSWWCQDLRSANGIFVADARVTEVALDHDLEIMIGPVRMEVHVETEPYEGTLEIDTRFRDEPLPKNFGWRVHVASILLLLGVSVLAYVLRSVRHDVPSDVVIPFLVLVGLMYGGSGVVSLFSKVHSKRYQFTRFLPLTAFLFASISVFTVLEDTVYFNFGGRGAGLTIEFLWKVGSLILALGAGLRIILAQISPRVIFGWVGGIILLVYGVLGAAQFFLDRDTDGFNNYGSIATPSVLTELRGSDLSAWERSFEELRSGVERARARALESGDFGEGELDDWDAEASNEETQGGRGL